LTAPGLFTVLLGRHPPLDAALPEMSEIDVEDRRVPRGPSGSELANRSRVIREAAGRGKPLMETASAWLGLTRWRWAWRTVRLKMR